MRGLLIALTVLLLGVTIYLVRYYLAVKSLSKQIEEKLVEESHRLSLSLPKLKRLSLSLSKKRKPWTWLSVILPMIYEHH